MKYIFAIVSSLFVFCCCNGCHEGESKQEIKLQTEQQGIGIDMKIAPLTLSEDKGVVMKIITDSLVRPFSRFKIQIVNNSNVNLTTGEDYAIEVWEFNRWVAVPLNFAFVDIAYGLAANGGRHNFTINLHPDQYEYTTRRYRVVKEVKEDGASFPYAKLKAEFDLSK